MARARVAVNHATVPSAAVNDVTSRVQNVCVHHVQVTFPNIKPSFHRFCHFGNIAVQRVMCYIFDDIQEIKTYSSVQIKLEIQVLN